MSGRRYLPLRAYGLVGDGRRTAALVARDGSVDWWPLPRLGDPTVFARLLDDRIGGFCSAAPAGSVHDSPLWESSQRYLPRTNVLLTEFRGADAALRVADFMPPAAGEAAVASSGPEAVDGAGTPVLLRRLTASGGPVDAEVRFAPRFDYARRRPDFRQREGGWLASARQGKDGEDEGEDEGEDGENGSSTLALAAGPELSLELDGRRREVSGRFRVEPGEVRWLALRWGRGEEVRPVRPGRCAKRLERTSAFWRARTAERAAEGGLAGAGALARSALLLDLLAVGPEGRVAAAPTTSLPGAGAPRDPRRLYSPRECGVGAGGREPETAPRAGSVGAAPVADLGDGGDRASGTETLEHLHGHRGRRPVVVGGGGRRGGAAGEPGGPAGQSARAGGADGGDAPVRLAGELRRAGELAREGRGEEARDRITSVTALAGPTGLLAEAAVPGPGRLLGDYPWAPAHAALIGAARALAEAGRGRATPGG